MFQIVGVYWGAAQRNKGWPEGWVIMSGREVADPTEVFFLNIYFLRVRKYFVQSGIRGRRFGHGDESAVLPL